MILSISGSKHAPSLSPYKLSLSYSTQTACFLLPHRLDIEVLSCMLQVTSSTQCQASQRDMTVVVVLYYCCTAG